MATVCKHMFVTVSRAVRGRIRRATALLRGVVRPEGAAGKSETAERSAATGTSSQTRRADAAHGLVGHLRELHPHRTPLAAPVSRRRPGVPPKPAVCLTPIEHCRPARSGPRPVPCRTSLGGPGAPPAA